jgi:anti-sigma regulatory factor (Ser/Thr protein kinase)
VSQAQLEPVEYVHRSWPADGRQLRLIRSVVRDWLNPLTLDDEQTADLVLAVDEATTNAVEHAYRPDEHGTVEVLLWTEAGALCIEIVDHGIWKTPSATSSFRGRGIQVMHSMCDSVLIHYDTRGTRVLLRHQLPDRTGSYAVRAGRPYAL